MISNKSKCFETILRQNDGSFRYHYHVQCVCNAFLMSVNDSNLKMENAVQTVNKSFARTTVFNLLFSHYIPCGFWWAHLRFLLEKLHMK